MTEEEFEIFIAEAMQELQEKQEYLKSRYNLGTYSRWWFEQATSILQFYNENDDLGLEVDVIDIGSYSPESSTWLWAWANVSVLPELRQKSGMLKELSEVTGYDLFENYHTFRIDEDMAWEMAALSVKQLNAKGCYRAPASTGKNHSFLAMMEIRLIN